MSGTEEAEALNTILPFLATVTPNIGRDPSVTLVCKWLGRKCDFWCKIRTRGSSTLYTRVGMLSTTLGLFYGILQNFCDI